MGEIVSIADAKNKVIDLQALQRSKIRSAAGLIAPATEETHCELAPEHAAEPIKKKKQKQCDFRISYFTKKIQR